MESSVIDEPVMDLSIKTAENTTEKTLNESSIVSNDDNNPEQQSSETVPMKKKRKKSKKIKRSAEYPKFYKNAYVRYCDASRAKICEENPTLDSVEITKLVAKNWYSLPKEEKLPYLEEARIDKERFERELKVYKDLNPGEIVEKPSKKKHKPNKNTDNELPKEPPPSTSSTPVNTTVSTPKHITSIPVITSTPIVPSTSSQHPILLVPSTSSQSVEKKDDEILKALIGQNCEIPIFTDTFLEHNKVIESEVKSLRKNNIVLDQQNSVLMKHIENMENGITKIESEIAINRRKNMQLEVYLTKLRVILSANFNSLQIPGWKGGATVENVDKYMTDLTKSSATTLNKARDIIKKIDLQI